MSRRLRPASTILTLALAPMRLAPAATIRRASSSVRMPPEAFTPTFGPTIAASAHVGVGGAGAAKPVEVLTKSAPATFASVQAITFCWSSSSAVSRITLTMAPLRCATSHRGEYRA